MSEYDVSKYDRRGTGIRCLRRDLNSLVRNEQGELSASKVGTLVGQWLAIKMILEHGSEIIQNWDSLTVLFMVLIAPEIFKKWLIMKWSGNGSAVTDKVVRSHTVQSGSAKGAG